MTDDPLETARRIIQEYREKLDAFKSGTPKHRDKENVELIIHARNSQLVEVAEAMLEYIRLTTPIKEINAFRGRFYIENCLDNLEAKLKEITHG